jgi:ParB-like chromosome segregation protein Spo0J
MKFVNETVERVDINDVYPDETNPRKPDPARLHLLRLSLSKMGFMLPLYTTKDGMLLSGHQRQTVSKELGFDSLPVVEIDLPEKDIRGINVIFNRATNDFGAFDTGRVVKERLTLSDIIDTAEEYPDLDMDDWPVWGTTERSIKGLAKSIADRYDKKAVVVANNLLRKGMRIPIVVTESGAVVNGVHRLFSARESGIDKWPVIEVPDAYAELAEHFLNYLSMDYHVDDEFADMLRYSAYRRPQNNRGSVPKSYRFWGNGERTLPDKDSYSKDYWRAFRDIHGRSLLDFGAGLCKVAPFLNDRGFDCADFEPYRINPQGAKGVPDPTYSKEKANEFLDRVGDVEQPFDSIFLASVLNSIPFPRDRMCVLAIVHSLCSYATTVYGTCRDISDFHYEYAGIRQANYFVFDSEPGVRLGDSIANPKIQKFHSMDEAKGLFCHFWNRIDTWPGGNVFYFRLGAPRRVNTKVLTEALEFEFDLPYNDGTRMGLVDKAKMMFGRRLGVKL